MNASIIDRELARVRQLAAEITAQAEADRAIQKAYDTSKGHPTARPLAKPTPYEEVLDHYTLPFPLYPFQQEVVNDFALHQRMGLYLDMGCGKTVTVSVIMLLKFIVGQAHRAVVIVPPILITQWVKFLATLGIEALAYKGTPAQRKKLHLGQSKVTVVSIGIFKNDYERFERSFGSDTFVICDEAHSLKNVGTDNHRRFRGFVPDKPFALLTGTPITSPADAYAFVSLVTPGIYRSQTQFKRLHEGDKDFFGNVISYRNLDLLNENMALNSVRILIEDVMKDLPKVRYEPIHYNLDPQHYKLYEKLATEQLLILEGETGGKIDATNSSALFHRLGQIVNNWGYFADDSTKVSAGFELVEQILDELGPLGKLVVFANYRMTNAALLSSFTQFGAVGAYGGQSVKQNMAAVERFINDPDCRLFVAQPSSAGEGLDGLQHAAHNGLFLEVPTLRQYRQASSRLHRAGQTKPVLIRLAVAEGTLQQRQISNLLANDETANKVIRNFQDLRSAIFGK